MQQRYNWEGTHVILFIFPGFAVKDQRYVDIAKQIPIWWSWQRSRFKNWSGPKETPGVIPQGMFINFHENHCPGPALSSKWLENYMEPHASSEIWKRSDMTTCLSPKPGGLAHEIFRTMQAPSRGLGLCFLRKFWKLVSWDLLKMHF